MSIATLKRKTNLGGNPRNDPISGIGTKGFALNGTLRNIGGVGQFRMVSNVTRTRFRGNTPMGYGDNDKVSVDRTSLIPPKNASVV